MWPRTGRGWVRLRRLHYREPSLLLCIGLRSCTNVRPLRAIETEIKELLQEAEDASKPFYYKLGPLLLEAKQSHFGNSTAAFYDWSSKKFGKSKGTIRGYLAFESSNGPKLFKNLHEFDYTPKSKGGQGRKPRPAVTRAEWAAPVNEMAQHAQREAFRLAQQEALTHAQEREAERKLAQLPGDND